MHAADTDSRRFHICQMTMSMQRNKNVYYLPEVKSQIKGKEEQ